VISLIRTESEFKKLLGGFSDQRIKKMLEHVEICPFPVLLLQEYARRFHPADMKRQSALISRQLGMEKLRQRRTLRELRTAVKKMGDYNISQNGLKDLSKKAVDGIHQKSRATVCTIQRLARDLERTNMKIAQYENILKGFQKR